MKKQTAQKLRNKRFEVRLTEEELSYLCRQADMCGKSNSRYVRDLIRGKTPVAFPPLPYAELLSEIRKLGVNMNQLALKAHSLGFIDEPEYRRNAKAVWRLCAKMSAWFGTGGDKPGNNKNMGNSRAD